MEGLLVLTADIAQFFVVQPWTVCKGRLAWADIHEWVNYTQCGANTALFMKTNWTGDVWVLCWCCWPLCVVPGATVHRRPWSSVRPSSWIGVPCVTTRVQLCRVIHAAWNTEVFWSARCKHNTAWTYLGGKRQLLLKLPKMSRISGLLFNNWSQ